MTDLAIAFTTGAVVFFFAGYAIGWSKGWAAGWYESDKSWAAMRDKEQRIHNW